MLDQRGGSQGYLEGVGGHVLLLGNLLPATQGEAKGGVLRTAMQKRGVEVGV